MNLKHKSSPNMNNKNEMVYQVPERRWVDEPTFVQDPDGNFHSGVQWFGKSKFDNISSKQFIFPINLPPRSLSSDRSIYKVITIARVKDWPKKIVIAGLVEQFKDEEMVIMQFLNTAVKTMRNNSWVPQELLVPMNIKLADEKHRIIEIQPFFDEGVLKKETKKICWS